MECYNSQVKSVYEAIGIYCVEFERMIDGMRRCVVSVFDHKDYDTRKRIYILLSGNTAGPITVKFHSILTDYLDDLKDIEVIGVLKNTIEKQITYRNQTIHAYMFVGYGNEETKDYLQFSKMTVTKKGFCFTEETYQNIKSNTNVLKQLNSFLSRLEGCLSFKELNIAKNFEFPDEWK
jgi:hypothetical protein